ncbi:hypothetical protein ACNF42_05155 [Cuniculiplasma sp. SKW3]|uniref:hypothetical protein n=1 Tax=unclassified Cuniculiplasma TaxID=2619706 RepID=UPI003FD0A310
MPGTIIRKRAESRDIKIEIERTFSIWKGRFIARIYVDSGLSAMISKLMKGR